MSSNTGPGEVIRISSKGQATIPKKLREKFGIETPGEVLVYESEGRIVVEPLPSLDELRGIHGGDYEEGEILEKVRKAREAEKNREEDRERKLSPDE